MIAERGGHPEPAPDGWRLELLLDAGPGAAPRRRGGPLPPALARRYGSELAIALRQDGPTIVANFVTTLDGVVAFDTAGRTGGREVSGGFAPDRFLMGLLRATADAVLVGAGTVRSGSGHVWSPGHVHPSTASEYADWRTRLGLGAAQPTTVMVTASGRIDADHPGLHRPDVPVLIATTAAGAARLGGARLPSNVEVVAARQGTGAELEPLALRSLLADHGFRLVVCEGGPTLFGDLVGAGLIDELFLTVAPQLAGRSADRPRLALVEGLAYEVGAAPWATLSSVLRAGSHLFLRYALASAAEDGLRGPTDPDGHQHRDVHRQRGRGVEERPGAEEQHDPEQ